MVLVKIDFLFCYLVHMLLVLWLMIHILVSCYYYVLTCAQALFAWDVSLMSGGTLWALCGHFAVIHLDNHFEHHMSYNWRFRKDCLQSDAESRLHEECRRRM